MGDVIWAAMIAVAGSSITGTIAYLGARLQAKTTAVDVAAQTTVELAKLRAENDRLWAQHREDERRNRQGTHHRLLAVLDRFENSRRATTTCPRRASIRRSLTPAASCNFNPWDARTQTACARSPVSRAAARRNTLNTLLGRAVSFGARAFVLDRAGQFSTLVQLIHGARQITLGADDAAWAINPWDVQDPATVSLERSASSSPCTR